MAYLGHSMYLSTSSISQRNDPPVLPSTIATMYWHIVFFQLFLRSIARTFSILCKYTFSYSTSHQWGRIIVRKFHWQKKTRNAKKWKRGKLKIMSDLNTWWLCFHICLADVVLSTGNFRKKWKIKSNFHFFSFSKEKWFEILRDCCVGTWGRRHQHSAQQCLA